MNNREELEVAYRDLLSRAAALEKENQLLQRELDLLRHEYERRLAQLPQFEGSGLGFATT